jgi:hypothetical protein
VGVTRAQLAPPQAGHGASATSSRVPRSVMVLRVFPAVRSPRYLPPSSTVVRSMTLRRRRHGTSRYSHVPTC